MHSIRLALRIGLVAGAIAALAGCQNPATKMSDADLAALLGGGQDIASTTVDCLRAWSRDPALTQGLPADQTSDPHKHDCRRTVESWLTVSQRNPNKLGFDDLDDPNVVKRVVAIAQQQQVAADKRAQAAAEKKKQAAEAAAAVARERTRNARIGALRGEFDSTLADLRDECARAETAIRHKRHAPANLRQQIAGCATKADAQQQQWAAAVARGDLTDAAHILKAAQESVAGAKTLAANAAKVRR